MTALAARWRALPRPARRALVIGVVLNELRGAVTGTLLLIGAHHLHAFPFH